MLRSTVFSGVLYKVKQNALCAFYVCAVVPGQTILKYNIQNFNQKLFHNSTLPENWKK
jgi:hypothetical protein